MTEPRPSLWQLSLTWIGIGWQSFGGGATTFTLIERAFVRQHEWLTRDEYVHNIALAQLSPGINLLGMTILIGKRLGGAAGVVVSLAGLLLPSVIITVFITAVYAQVAHQAVVERALHGIIPATVGLGMTTAIGLAVSQLRHPDGRWVNALLLLGSAVVAVTTRLPVVVILLGAGLLGALDALRRARR